MTESSLESQMTFVHHGSQISSIEQYKDSQVMDTTISEKPYFFFIDPE